MKNLVFGSCVFLMVGCSAMVGAPPVDGDNLDKESGSINLKFTPEEANGRALKIVSHICHDGKKAEVWNAHYIGRELKFNFKCV